MLISTRRQLLKRLGVGLPVAWMTPVVSSVVLPAHAQTSPPPPPPPPPQMFDIGDTGPGGGIVFYLESGSDRTRGLEAATADQDTGTPWGCFPVDVTGATDTGIGTGGSNTQAILDANCSGSAAMAAAAVGPGWFLPSQDELNELFNQRAIVGGFTDDFYWSSSQSSALNAQGQFFSVGSVFPLNKTNSLRVRAVRAF